MVKRIILFSVLLFVVGFCTYDLFLQLVLPQSANLKFDIASLDAQLINQLRFGAVIALFPWVYWMVSKLGKITTRKGRLFVALTLVATVILSLLLWYVLLMPAISWMEGYQSGVETHIDLSNFELEIFMMGGMLVGAVLAFAMFRGKS
ncbi:MAG: hypothetical protein Q8928_08260 [Bacteroidota bacterium]|nr:hypothetical protein [Bacteroidota bacterium]